MNVLSPQLQAQIRELAAMAPVEALDLLCAEAAPRAIEARRHLHRNPELSWQERGTQAYLREQLEELGLVPRVAARTGLVVDVGQGQPLVVYRADMDALPLQDAKDPAHASCVSTVDGVCHACGHDLHAAVALGLARALVSLRERLPGRVRIVFQPAEEVAPSGGEALVAAGHLEGAVACLALHADPSRFAGRVGLRAGPMTAAGDGLRIQVLGHGGHSSRPYLARDPILAAARVIEALSSLVPQRVAPTEPAVLTLGSVHGGAAPNVIPDRVELTGTVRTFSEEVRYRLHELVPEVALAAAATQGCTAEVEITRGAPGLVNDPGLDRILRAAAADALGEQAIESIPVPSTGIEDFSYYGQQAPAYMVRLGVREVGAEAFHLHHPRFDVDEDAIGHALRIMSRALVRILEAHGGRAPRS